MDYPLAELVPLWRTLREEDTTLLVTPAMDYVGALELRGLDVRFVGDEEMAGLGEALRSFVGGLEDRCNLLFLSRVEEGDEAAIRAYEARTGHAEPLALREYVESRAAWLRQQKVRRSRLFLFFSSVAASKSNLERGNLGMKLLFKPVERLGEALHRKKVGEVGALRDRLGARLKQLGIGSRELGLEEVWRLYYQLLNPGRARRGFAAPSVALQDNFWSEEFVRQHGRHHLELTEAEQLCFEDFEDARGHFRQGGVFRRACTLKVLPEGGTHYFDARALQSLGTEGPGGEGVPFGYTLAVAMNVESQPFVRWKLNTQHKLTEALRSAVPFLRDSSVGKEVEDAARQRSITELFVELNEMATKVVTLSVSLLLEADTLEELEARTEVARAAFAAAGNSELEVEDVAQLPAFLSMLPGSGPYQLRKKGCTSRNAADFLPLLEPWCGGETGSLMLTPSGEFFRFAPFDQSLANAFHAIACADTGAGKSVAVGALLLDALATGLDAILVDNGNSWRGLTQAMGGVHIPVDLGTSICPFGPYAAMADAEGQLDTEAVRQVVRFIEVCVTDAKLPAFDLLQQDVVGRAVSQCYRERFRQRPGARPLMGDFREFIRRIAETGGHPRDREVAAELDLRLRIFTDDDGVYARFLNRPSSLRFDSRLLTFEMEKVSKDALTKKIALAAIMEAVSTRATSSGRRAIVAVDEAHEYLGADAAAETWLAGCYAKMRKYGVAMWTVSQKFETFASARVAPTIIGNSSIKLFLWHSSGHDVVGRYFRLPPRAVREFAALKKRPGHYSDAFVMYGERRGVMRLALHPLAYWLLTTDDEDKRLLEKAAALNPALERWALLKEMAARFPHGARTARATKAA